MVGGRRRLLPLLAGTVLLLGVVLLLLELLLLGSAGPASPRLAPPPPPPDPPDTPPEPPPATDAQWVAVKGAPHKLLLYSAYLDRRRPNGPTVVVVGATVTTRPAALWCRLQWHGDRRPLLVEAEVKNIRENWSLKYSAVFVLCPLPGGDAGDGPAFVTVTATLGENAHNRLVVQNRELREAPVRSIGVCVKPLHFRYDAVAQLVEYIELQRLLGVDRFTFYNSSVGPRVGCALRWYAARGGVTVLPWSLSLRSQRDIRTEGMFAALNDCLLRSLPHSSHIAMLDLDEAIVPRLNVSLHGLLDALENGLGTRRRAAAFSFQNTFFYLGWPDDESAGSALTALSKTQRRTYRHPHGQRSKYLAVPELVLEAGNHFVWQTVPGHGTVHVAPAMATLHHYRHCEFGGQACLQLAHVRDTGTQWLADGLKRAVAAALAGIGAQCPEEMAVNAQDWRPLVE